MKNNQAVSFDDVLAQLLKDEEFRKADRQVKPYYELVKAIIHRRNELGLTQKDLAEKANTHQSRISKIESAEHDIRLSTLIQIAEALDTEVSIRLLPIEKVIYYRIDQKANDLFNLVFKFRGVSTESKIDKYSVNPGYEKIYDQEYTIPV
jgi:predicted transcriptional regulator